MMAMVESYTESRLEGWRSALRAAYTCSTVIRLAFLQCSRRFRTHVASISLFQYRGTSMYLPWQWCIAYIPRGVTLIDQMLRVTCGTAGRSCTVKVKVQREPGHGDCIW